MKLGREELEQLKAKLSITAVAERLGHSVIKGKLRCPYHKRHAHGDRTPSVSISEDKGLFRCWVCDDVRGDVFNLVQLTRGGNFQDALDWLNSEFNPGTALRSEKKNFDISTPEKLTRDTQNKDLDLPPLFREKIVLSFLKLLKPVDGTAAARWLAKRKIFKKSWDCARLRFIEDYNRVHRELLSLHSLEDLQKAGLYNEKGHLRYYRHPLILPYLDEEFRPHYFQARSIDTETKPKELNLKGSVPFPYNKSVLDGHPGWIYLCEGVIDTLTVQGKGFNAVGIPGAKSFKTEWIELFKNNKIVLCLDNDAAGQAGTELLKSYFDAAGFETTQLELPPGKDINDWFGGRK